MKKLKELFIKFEELPPKVSFAILVVTIVSINALVRGLS